MVELRLSGVGKTYAGEVPLEALRDVTLTIRQGEFISIQGPSGAGKSTLLNQLALLDTPTSGDYLIDGVGVRTLGERRRAVVRSENFAFIFQSFHLLQGRSVVENVALGLLYRGLGHRRRLLAARRALDFVGLGRKSSQRVEKLSGGERQRAAIARAIASGAPVIVADEPTGNLDSRNSDQVMELLSGAYGDSFDAGSVDAARFAVHLRYFLVRARTTVQIQDSTASLVTRALRAGNPDAYRVALRIRDLLELRLGTSVTDDETAYLALHVARLAAASASTGHPPGTA